jgi:hypothetical protein
MRNQFVSVAMSNSFLLHITTAKCNGNGILIKEQRYNHVYIVILYVSMVTTDDRLFDSFDVFTISVLQRQIVICCDAILRPIVLGQCKNFSSKFDRLRIRANSILCFKVTILAVLANDKGNFDRHVVLQTVNVLLTASQVY